MENANPSSTLGSSSQEPSVTTHAKFTARINKLLQMRQTIDSLLFKTMNELTNQSSDSEIFCPEERIKELELRTQRRNNFEEELFKDRFPTEKELAYHKELLGEPQPPFSTLEPKIKRGDPWSLKIPCVIGTVYTGHAYIDLQSPVNIMSRAYYNKIREKSFQARRNPYQPYKFCNFVGRAKNVHIFIGCFVYVVDFMILEDFKQQQNEMTNKIDTVLKAITDRIAGALPSDTVKNPKLSTSLVLSACSYPTIDPQCSSHPSTSINAIKAHSKEATISQTSLLQPEMEIEMQQPEELEPTLKEEF
ncbi:hypothetical protein Tco_1492845 [Tanacetum coccineum]